MRGSRFRLTALASSLRGANGSRECAPDDRLRDEAIQLSCCSTKAGLLRFARNDVERHALLFSRRGFRLSVANSLASPEREAQGKPGADCARSTVCKKETTHTGLTGTAETSRLSPRNGF